MRLPSRPGRLFWKLLLALLLSMLLSMFGSLAYFTMTSSGMPEPPSDMRMIGPLPAAPIVVGLSAALIIGLAFAWYLSRPVRALSQALQRMADGDFAARAKPRMSAKWRDEIVDLGHDFDRMAEQLQHAVESQRTLLHDVSHELRSPLARMQAAIGLLRQNPASGAEMIDRIEAESQRLDSLIEELLTLHRLDAGVAQGHTEWVDLMELLQAIVEDAAFEAQASGKNVTLLADGSFIAPVQGELIYRAFENVIRNAVKFSPVGETIEVMAQPTPSGTLIIRVSDRGPGVPNNLQQRIFEPFFRAKQTGRIAGNGLGLAIAHRAITRHGGDIKVASRPGGGLMVVMTLPGQS